MSICGLAVLTKHCSLTSRTTLYPQYCSKHIHYTGGRHGWVNVGIIPVYYVKTYNK